MIAPFVRLFDDLSILELFSYHNIKRVHFNFQNLFSLVLNEPVTVVCFNKNNIFSFKHEHRP